MGSHVSELPDSLRVFGSGRGSVVSTLAVLKICSPESDDD